MKLYKLNKLLTLITTLFLSHSVFALPNQNASWGNTITLPGGNDDDPYKSTGFINPAIMASGSGSQIIVQNGGIKAESSNLTGTGVVYTENGGFVNLGDGSILTAEGLNPTEKWTGPTGILSKNTDSLVKANNIKINVSGNRTLGVYVYDGGRAEFSGTTEINAMNRDNSNFDATGLYGFGGVITAENVNVTIGSLDGNYAKEAYGVMSSGASSNQIENKVNINGHLQLDIMGLDAAVGVVVNRFDPNLPNASIEIESVSGSITALGDNSEARGLQAINGNLNITKSINNFDLVSKGKAYGFIAQNSGNLNITADIGHISVKANSGRAVGMFASSQGQMNVINNADSPSALDISSVNGLAAAFYSSNNGSINHQGNAIFNVTSTATGSSAYGINAFSEANVTLNGNTQWNIANLVNSAVGFRVNNGHIKQTGQANLQVNGKEAYGLVFAGTDASIEIENIIGQITSTESSGEANTIYVSGGASSNPNQLSIKGDTNYLETNGTNIVADNGFLSANLKNTTLNSTINKSFDVQNSSGLTIDADNSYFIGDSVVDETSQFDLSLINNSRWDIKTNSNVTNLSNQSGSIIDLRNEDSSQYNQLIVDGNYVGGNNKPTLTNPYPTGNGLVIVNTLWNNSHSFSDNLYIKGTADGYTEVKTEAGIIGDVRNDGTEKYSADVITVDNHGADKNAFYGFADTAGAGQAILKQRDDNHYAWYLNKDSLDPVIPVDPIKPEVPAYLMTKKANMELGHTLISTLHQRMGESETMNWGKTALSDDKQTWGRFLAQYSKNRGENRFGYRSKLWGIQFGHDFDVKYNEENGSRTHTGLMFTYARDSLTFSDNKFVTFDKSVGDYVSGYQQTGTGYTNAFALALNSTHYTKNGSYVDLVGQIDYMRNKYHSIRADNTSNDSYGLTLSAEIGRPYTLNPNWKLEPQAQLVYQYRKFNNFTTLNNIYVNVSDDSTPSLRGRIGLRLAYNDSDENSIQPSLDTFYVIANLHNEFIYNHDSVAIGNSSAEESFSRAQGEIGTGLQLAINESAYLYGDIRYFHSLDNSKGNKREYSGNIGIKWQL